MRVNARTGVKTLFGFGPQIKNSVAQKPDGSLPHENFIMSVIRPHLGMRNTGATSMPWRPGRGRRRIASGGGISCARRTQRGHRNSVAFDPNADMAIGVRTGLLQTHCR
jgi:hypothetical protein